MGTAEDTKRLREEIGQEMQELQICEELDLNQVSMETLVNSLHVLFRQYRGDCRAPLLIRPGGKGHQRL